MEARLSAPITSDDHAQGPNDATVTLVQYGDYECPYTRRSTWVVQAIQQQLGDQLRFVYRNFPLTEIHPHTDDSESLIPMFEHMVDRALSKTQNGHA